MKFIAIFLIAVYSVCTVSGTCSSYGGDAGVPSPPCPKNYLFSCQPNLVPVPCSAPAPAPAAAPASYASAPAPAAYASAGSAGAYTEQMPTYAYFADYLRSLGYEFQP